MAEKSYVTHIALHLGVGAVLILGIFILVAHHRDVPERARIQQRELLSSGRGVAERIKPVARVEVAGVESAKQPQKAAAASALARNGQQVYQAACVACHGTGVAGAPKLGDKGKWAKRIGKGVNALYLGAINGMQSPAGVMPAKGGNPSLSDVEVKAAVDYMIAQSR